ncbi:hypothetical protein D3C84_456110 [compost metagenome]
MLTICPFSLLIVCKSLSLAVFNWLLSLAPVYIPSVYFAIPFRIIIPFEIGKLGSVLVNFPIP